MNSRIEITFVMIKDKLSKSFPRTPKHLSKRTRTYMHSTKVTNNIVLSWRVYCNQGRICLLAALEE